jgi:hypothetical protein
MYACRRAMVFSDAVQRARRATRSAGLRQCANDGEDGPRSGHMFMTIGRVVEIATPYVVIETLRGQGARGHGGQKLLLGVAHIVAMRRISSENT